MRRQRRAQIHRIKYAKQILTHNHTKNSMLPMTVTVRSRVMKQRIARVLELFQESEKLYSISNLCQSESNTTNNNNPNRGLRLQKRVKNTQGIDTRKRRNSQIPTMSPHTSNMLNVYHMFTMDLINFG